MSAEFGSCLMETRGTRIVVVKADDRILISDALVHMAGDNRPAMAGLVYMRLDGNVIAFGDPVVEYELVGWSAGHGAHIAEKLGDHAKRRVRQRRRSGQAQ